MRFFFGKISSKVDIKQLEEGYYSAPKDSSWFGELRIGDYVYVIGGNKIQFWKAKEWGNKNGKECLFFEILNSDLKINLSKFTSLNFLYLNSDLIVLTYRSSRNKAFYELTFLEDISIDKLKDTNFYNDENLYRKIKVHKNGDSLKLDDCKDLQFYFENNSLKLFYSDFIDSIVYDNFVDNTAVIGLGSNQKDQILKIFKESNPNPTITFTHSEIPFIKLYDAFFCNYKQEDKDVSIKYWLYAPGENASKWEEFYSEGIMCLGWDQLGDLDQYTSKKDIKKKLQELEGVESSKQNDTAANFEFHKVIKEGDIVIVKKGISELLGYGVVTSDYFYDENRASYQKCRKVDWKLKGSWKVDFNLPVKTLTDVTKYPTEDPNYSKYYERLLAIMDGKGFNSSYKQGYSNYLTTIYGENSGTKTSYVKAIEILSKLLNYNIFEVNDLLQLQQLYADLIKEQRNTEGKYFHPEAPSYGQNGFYSASIKTYIDFHKQLKDNSMNSSTYKAPLNQILYGPPGTGKTYDTINKAISIINPDFNLNQSRKIIKEEFDRLEKESNILFSTFHQSMSYEDFIEGIKPLPPLPNEVLNYDIQAGIFKIACARAAYLCYKKYNKVNDVILTPYSFEDLYYAFIESIKPSIKKGIFPTYKTLTGKDVEIYEINSQDSIKARAKGSIATHVAPLTQDNLEKLYNKFKDISEIKSLDLVREAVQVSPRITEFYAVFGGLKDFESTFKLDNEIIEEDILVDTTDDLEKVKKFTSGIYTEAIKQFGYEAEPVVLIIDEINRGNVSAIFGELITLIEHDKRIGATNEIRVKLPYSKKEFGVPPNLYIIGTMNTADRSVEALDTALRRRFSFVEMPPKYDLKELENEVYGFALKDILETINKRIVRLLNNDHVIGHSYFLNKDEDSIIESFNRNIIPLLQEYFFGDYGKMMLVLGDGFVTYDEWKEEEKFFASYAEAKNDYDVKDLYSIKNYKTKEKEGFAEALKKLMNR